MKRLWVAAALFGVMTVSALAIELPAEIAKRGSLKVALVPNYPPMEFRDPATNALSGFDIDLGEAIGRKLGVKIEWQETSFARVHAVDLDRAGGRHPVRFHGLREPSRHRVLRRLSQERSAVLRAAVAQGGVQGRGIALRQEGRRQPPHHVPGADRGVEREELRQQSDPVHRHRRLGRRPHPAEAGPHRCRGPGQRDAALHYGSRTRRLCARGRAHRAAIHRHRPAGQGKGTAAGHSRSGRCADRRRHPTRPCLPSGN
ncbi:hypothetical protein ACVWXN_010277 [Bradyrhizobium sp. i1.4.4]